MRQFEDLEVYQKSFDFTVKIFELTKNATINYNIINQLERAALSIPNNIAEGLNYNQIGNLLSFYI